MRAPLVLAALLALALPAGARAGDYSDAVLATPGLAGYWRMHAGGAPSDEVTGRPATNDGPMSGWGPGVTEDRDSAWIPDFARPDGAVDTGVYDDAIAGDFTYEAWVLRTDRAASVIREAAYGELGPSLSTDDRGVRGDVATQGPDGWSTYHVTAPVPHPNAWHHVAFAYDGSSAFLYLDGELAGTTAAPGPRMASPENIRMGPTPGGLDELAIYDRALDPATIRAHARLGDDGAPPRTEVVQAPVDNGTEYTPAVFRAARAGTVFECSFDQAAFSPCESPLPARGPDGPHELAIRAYDRFGRVEDPPTIVRWVADHYPPPTIGAALVPVEPDRPSLVTFGSEPGARFECQSSRPMPNGPVVDPSAWRPCAPPLTIPRTSRLLVRAIDAGGNLGLAPAFFDAYPYATPGSNLVGVSQRLQPWGYEPIWKLQCRFDDEPWAPCPADGRLPALKVGLHSLGVSAVESSGTVRLMLAPLPLTVAPLKHLSLVALQFPLIVERSRRLLKRAPRIRLLLSDAAALTITIVRRGGRNMLRTAAAGSAGANVIKLSARALHALRPGRYSLRVRAVAPGGATARASVPFAVIAARR